MAVGQHAALGRIIADLRRIFGTCCRVDRRRKHPIGSNLTDPIQKFWIGQQLE